MTVPIPRCILACLVAAGLFSGGCAIHVSDQPAVDEPTISLPQPPTDAYFYYLAALRLEQTGQKNSAVDMISRAMADDPRSRYLPLARARLLVDLNRPDEAMADLNRLLSAHPDTIEALAMVGGIERSRGRLATAAKAYARTIALSPGSSRLYLILADIYAELGKPEKSRRTYEALLKQYPEDVAGLIYLGRWHLIHGDPTAGERLLKKAATLRDDLELPHSLLGRLYEDTQRLTDAAEAYEAVLDINPDNISVAFRLVLIYQQLKRMDPAQEILRGLGTAARDDEQVINTLVENYMQEETMAQAAQLLDGMLLGAPDHQMLHYLAAVADDALGHNESALDHLSRVDSESVLFGDAAVRMARIYRETGQTATAIDNLNRSLARFPDRPGLYFQKAVLYESIDQYDDALAALAAGLAVSPGNTRLLYRKGMIEERRGDRSAAMDTMQAVIARDPTHADALNYIGYAYAEQGNHLAEAETMIKTALTVKPDAGYILDSLGWVYYRQGRYDEALVLLQRANVLDDQDPTILEHLADTLVKLNQWKNAVDYYRRSRDLHQTPADRQRITDKMRPLESAPR